MVQQYLLPCECGKATPVTVAQAGRTLACDCGRDQKVPSLAVLRQLEPVEALPAKGANVQWSSTRGTLFVIGVLATLVGLAAGGLGAYLIRRIDLNEVDQFYAKIEDDHIKEIDQMTPIQAYEVWEKIREMGPGVPLSAPELQYHKFYQFWLRVSLIGFACAAIGLLTAMSTLIGSRGKS